MIQSACQILVYRTLFPEVNKGVAGVRADIPSVCPNILFLSCFVMDNLLAHPFSRDFHRTHFLSV